MKARRFASLVLTASASLAVMSAGGAVRAEAATVRHYAILVANNQGGAGTVDLRYAEADARKLAQVLREIGGYRDRDIVTLVGAGRDEVLRALDALEERIRGEADATSAGSSSSLLFYYSGHAKQGHLRLGSTQLSMAEIRRRLSTSKARVRLGILDSCESGAITREKGGRRGKSFLLDVDDRDTAKGLILISSSSADESSQESDEIGGSFFTHYLTSGLRGDADASGDQRITLGEVYAYAYHKTVNTTASTRSGPQHPSFSYDLEGQGDLVLTDLSQGTSGIFFPPRLAGDYMVFDLDRDQVALEISKREGEARRLALPVGHYVVKRRRQDHLEMARFTISRPDDHYEVDESKMAKVAFEDDYAKGIVLRSELESKRPRLGLSAIAVYQSFLSGATRRELFAPIFLVGVSGEISALLGTSLTLDFELLVGGRRDRTLALQSLELSYDFFEAQAALSITWSKSVGPVALAAGPRLAGLYMRRSFPNNEVLSAHPQDHFGLSPGLGASATWFLTDARNLSVEGIGRLGCLPFSVDDNRTLFYAEVGLAVGWRL
ncbi:MAG: caspase family protein [Deltaproteobacteria bacterium]|nr:caspase family protein [Deltaproteobacteria bacterium]